MLEYKSTLKGVFFIIFILLAYSNRTTSYNNISILNMYSHLYGLNVKGGGPDE